MHGFEVELPSSLAAENASPNQAAPLVPPIKFPTAAAPTKAVAPLRAEHDSSRTGVASSERDALTPRLLEALASLDAEMENLSAISTPRDISDGDDADPAWLREAEEAVVQTCHPLEPPAAAAAVEAETVTRVATLSRELEASQALGKQLRVSAESQAATTKEVLQQLELTKTAAETTAAAARKIVDDHEKDVAYLLSELRALAEPEHIARIEAKLSAPLVALAARRKNAKAAHAQAKRAASPKRHARAPLAAPSVDATGGTNAPSARGAFGLDDPDASGWLAPVLADASAKAADVLQNTQAQVAQVAQVAADVRREVMRAARANSPFRGRPVSPKPGRA